MKVKNNILFALIALGLFTAQFTSAQNLLKKMAEPDTSKHKKVFINGLPFIGYAPETRFAFGAVGIANFHLGTDTISQRPSSLQVAFIITQNKQAFFYVPYQLFFDVQRYSVYGEVGYYKYNYQFFGLGNNQPPNFSEEYFVNYPRLRTTALRKVTPILYAGLKYSYDNFTIVQEDPNGELIADTIPGSRGGVISGLGPVITIDSRDNIFYPSKGVYAEVFWQPFTKWMGSDFSYSMFSFNGSKYLTTFPKQIVAFNLYYEYAAGTPPFYEMPYIGGNQVLRGYFEGKYRDNYASAIQAEYRFAIWKAILGDVFGGVGEVFHTPLQASTDILRSAYGLGLRLQLDPVSKVDLRFDMGVAYHGSPAFYFTYGEAF